MNEELQLWFWGLAAFYALLVIAVCGLCIYLQSRKNVVVRYTPTLIYAASCGFAIWMYGAEFGFETELAYPNLLEDVTWETFAILTPLIFTGMSWRAIYCEPFERAITNVGMCGFILLVSVIAAYSNLPQ